MKNTLTILCLTAFAGLGFAQNPDCPLGGQGPCNGAGPGNGAQPCRQNVVPGPRAQKNVQMRGQRQGRRSYGRFGRGGGRQAMSGFGGQQAMTRFGGRQAMSGVGGQQAKTGVGGQQAIAGQGCRLTMAGPGGGPGTGPGTGIPPVSGGVYRAFVKRLNDTLAEELYAHDYYDAAYAALGVKTFKNLANAETNHANAVANMIVFLGGTPDFTASHAVTVPATLAEADAECVAIELMVIEVYKGLIKDAPVTALLRPLNNIQAANYKHLAAVGG